MRAILIDPYTQKVSRITLEGETLQALYKAIGCHTVTRQAMGASLDLWLDDEGLLVEDPCLWTFEGASQPYAGRGVLLGHDGEGECVDCPDEVKPEGVQQFVIFPEPGSMAAPELEWRYIPIE